MPFHDGEIISVNNLSKNPITSSPTLWHTETRFLAHLNKSS